MEFGRLTLLVFVVSVPWLASCEKSRAEVARQTSTIRVSAGVPTGTFGPFSEALVRGYNELMPELRIELVDTPGSVRNLEALENGVVDLGLAQAGIAYMAYNGRLPDSHQPLRNIRDELFQEVWGFLDTSTTRSVDRAVSRLRQKIEADPRAPRFLRTVHGDGYILTPEAVI